MQNSLRLPRRRRRTLLLLGGRRRPTLTRHPLIIVRPRPRTRLRRQNYPFLRGRVLSRYMRVLEAIS